MKLQKEAEKEAEIYQIKRESKLKIKTREEEDELTETKNDYLNKLISEVMKIW